MQVKYPTFLGFNGRCLFFGGDFGYEYLSCLYLPVVVDFSKKVDRF